MLLGALVALQPVAALAQDIGNGELIAKTWCAGCHAVESPRLGGKNVIPSFMTIAEMNTTTNASLIVFLSTPHARMPNYNLTRDEIRDVSAYILSLRK
jgi:mono/diheme cytochrome c family protein